MNDQNTLYPITDSAAGFGQFEPALIPHGYRYQHLPAVGYKFRSDLDGNVQEQSGRPVVEVENNDGPELFIVGNPSKSVQAAWAKAIPADE